MRKDHLRRRLCRDTGGPTPLGLLAGLLALCLLLGVLYAAFTLAPQVFEVADGDPVGWEGVL